MERLRKRSISFSGPDHKAGALVKLRDVAPAGRMKSVSSAIYSTSVTDVTLYQQTDNNEEYRH